MRNFIIILGFIVLTGCGLTIGKREKLTSFNLLLVDSTTILNTASIPEGKPFVLIYFSPDCDHCQKETEDILKNIKALANIKLYYITSDPMERLQVFRDYYKTSKYPNIILSKDYQYGFIKSLRPTTTPYSIVYNKDKTPVAVFAGESNAKDLIKVIKNL